MSRRARVASLAWSSLAFIVAGAFAPRSSRVVLWTLAAVGSARALASAIVPESTMIDPFMSDEYRVVDGICSHCGAPVVYPARDFPVCLFCPGCRKFSVAEGEGTCRRATAPECFRIVYGGGNDVLKLFCDVQFPATSPVWCEPGRDVIVYALKRDDAFPSYVTVRQFVHDSGRYLTTRRPYALARTEEDARRMIPPGCVRRLVMDDGDGGQMETWSGLIEIVPSTEFNS